MLVLTPPPSSGMVRDHTCASWCTEDGATWTAEILSSASSWIVGAKGSLVQADATDSSFLRCSTLYYDEV